MTKKRSHGSGLMLAAAIGVPVLVALTGSFLLGREVFNLSQLRARTVQAQGVRAQSRLLLGDVWSSLENVRIRATNRISNVGIETISLFTGPVSETEKNELRRTGFAVVPELRAGRSSLLQLLFYSGAASGTARPQLLLTEVNPTQIFSSFSRWSTRREAGNLRGYLIGADGKVLAHSEKIYTGSDFSGTEVFKTALRSLFRGERVSGIATYTGADLRPVLTSYEGMGNLPLAVVVERVVHPTGAFVLRENAVPGVLFLAFLALICGVSYFVLRDLTAAESIPAELVPALSQVASARGQRTRERIKARDTETALSNLPVGADVEPPTGPSLEP